MPAWNTILWGQFGAAIDMLENAMLACPDELWSDPSKRPEWSEKGIVGFWYLAYHTLFFLDLQLSGSVEGFAPPTPFNLDELDPAGLLPERPYTKEDLGNYLQHCRRKGRETIAGLEGDRASAEQWLSSMRHVQHHTAQLNLLLRLNTGAAPRWVRRAE
jgi:hypothetical protein